MFAPIPEPPYNSTKAQRSEYRRAIKQRQRHENIYAAIVLGFLALGGLAGIALPIIAMLL